MFSWYCQTETDTLVPARVYCDDKMLEEEIQKPLNEDIVPHFSFLNSNYMEGPSRILSHHILQISPKRFPSHVENLPKSSLHSQIKTEKLPACILFFRA